MERTALVFCFAVYMYLSHHHVTTKYYVHHTFHLDQKHYVHHTGTTHTLHLDYTPDMSLLYCVY